MALTRRGLLRASGVGIVGALAGCAGSEPDHQETTTTEAMGATTTTPTQEPDETIVLGGQVEYWYGVAPSSIQGTENPTLTMEPGTVYEIAWINLDGIEHELRLFDADDNEVAASETVSDAGTSTSVVIEATESLARYDCRFHPQNMQGQVSQDGATTDGGTTTPGEETTATDEETTATDEETTTEGGGGPY